MHTDMKPVMDKDVKSTVNWDTLVPITKQSLYMEATVGKSMALPIQLTMLPMKMVIKQLEPIWTMPNQFFFCLEINIVYKLNLKFEYSTNETQSEKYYDIFDTENSK